MLMIRPKTIGATELTASNIVETVPAVWSGATTYAAGDVVAADFVAATIQNNNNMRCTPLAGGDTRLEKVTGIHGDFDADAISAEAFTGDCLVRFQPKQLGSRFMIGLNADPLTDSNYTGIDRAVYFQNDNIAYFYESSVNTATFTTYNLTDWWFLRRVGTTITLWRGPTTDIAAATLIHTATALSGTISFDCSFAYTHALASNQADVFAIYAPSAASTEVAMFRSLQAGNLNHQPVTSPTWWEDAGISGHRLCARRPDHRHDRPPHL
jgi:hypothetical protein